MVCQLRVLPFKRKKTSLSSRIGREVSKSDGNLGKPYIKPTSNSVTLPHNEKFFASLEKNPDFYINVSEIYNFLHSFLIGK